MKWTSCTMLVAALTLLCVVGTHGFCGETPPVWRNNNITCPDRAVCADVFETVRDWYNGTRCEEKRTLHNCMCPGGTVCPYNDPAHRLYSTEQHHMYTCQPVCNLPYCGNVRQRPGPGRGPGRVTPTTALTAEQNAVDFGYRTYYRMNCRCPRHHNPYTRTPGFHRAVKAYTHRYNYALHQYSILYICNVRGNEDQQPDPCANQ